MSFTLEPDGKQNGAIGKPTLEQVKIIGLKIGMSDEDCEEFWHHYESNGWRVGGTLMKSWRSSMHGWKFRMKRFAPKGNGAMSIGDMRTVLKAKTDRRDDLRRRHRTDCATEKVWSSEPARLEAVQLGKEIEVMTQALARMA